MINVNVLKQLRSEYVDPPDVHENSLLYEDDLINFELRERESERSPLAFSRSFIKEIIDNYWKTVCHQKKVDMPLREANFSFSRLSYEELRLANKIGILVGNMDAVHAGYYVSSIYAKIMPPERRASLGVFYTPPAIVDRLLENVTGKGFDWRKGKILDPACGGGAFLAPLALKLLKESGCKDLYIALEDIERKLKGYEIDGFAAWMSMVFLDAALLDVYKVVKRKIKNIVEVRDTLTLTVGNNEFFDLIIGNPPYGKISLQPYLREFYSRSLYGHANLYGLFMDAALRLSNPGGMIAFVTSTSYLGGMYFKALRQLFKHEAPPVLMDFIEERKGVFDEVLQETMLTLFRKDAEKTPGININVVKVNGSESSITVEHIGRFILNSRDNEPWQIPRNKAHLSLFENIKKMKCRLEHLGYTVITGQLVWNRHKSQLTDNLEDNSYPLIWAESVMNDENFKFNYSRRNHKPYFELLENQEYLLTREACILVQRTTAKEQRKRIVAAILPGSFVNRYKGVVIENHLNIIKPIGKEVWVSFEVLKFILNSSALDMVFRSMNGSVAVSAYELKSLPMPDFHQLQLIERMIEEKLSREEIESKLAEFYGVRYVIA